MEGDPSVPLEDKVYPVLDPEERIVGMVHGRTAFEALMKVPPNHGIYMTPMGSEEFSEDFGEVLDGVEELIKGEE